MPMLKTATNGAQFQRNAKKYVINMLGKKRKLHKKNGCYYAKCFSEYYDFDSFEEARASGLEFTQCRKCFK